MLLRFKIQIMILIIKSIYKLLLTVTETVPETLPPMILLSSSFVRLFITFSIFFSLNNSFFFILVKLIFLPTHNAFQFSR